MNKFNGFSKFGIFIGVLMVFAFVNTVVYFGYNYFATKYILPQISWVDMLLILTLVNIANFKIFAMFNIFFPVVNDDENN